MQQGVIAPPGTTTFAMPVSKEIYEAMQGISNKRKEKIDSMLDKNVPTWKRWIMKKFKIGKLFAYAMRIEGISTKKGEMVREKITLMCGNKELDHIIFTVKIEESPALWEMMPRTDHNTEVPGYIG